VLASERCAQVGKELVTTEDTLCIAKLNFRPYYKRLRTFTQPLELVFLFAFRPRCWAGLKIGCVTIVTVGKFPQFDRLHHPIKKIGGLIRHRPQEIQTGDAKWLDSKADAKEAKQIVLN
jgi:hypothetical protein